MLAGIKLMCNFASVNNVFGRKKGLSRTLNYMKN